MEYTAHYLFKICTNTKCRHTIRQLQIYQQCWQNTPTINKMDIKTGHGLKLKLYYVKTRVVFILGIFEYFFSQRLIWFQFQINKNKYFPCFKSISVLTWHDVLALNYQLFYPTKEIVKKIIKLCLLYSSSSNYPLEFLQMFSYYSYYR